MTTTYTDNLELPLLSTGSSNWDAVINAMIETIDTELSREVATYGEEVQVYDGYVQKIRVKN